jgi:hypothetical protein
MQGVVHSPNGLVGFDAAVGCEWRLIDGVLPENIESYRRPINDGVSRLILPPGTLTEAQLYYVRCVRLRLWLCLRLWLWLCLRLWLWMCLLTCEASLVRSRLIVSTFAL